MNFVYIGTFKHVFALRGGFGWGQLTSVYTSCPLPQHNGTATPWVYKKPSVRLLSSLFNPSCEGSCPRVTLQHGFPTLEKIKWGAVCYKQCFGRCKVTIAASLKQLPCNGNGLFLKVSHGQMVFTGCALLLTPLLKLHSLIYFSLVPVAIMEQKRPASISMTLESTSYRGGTMSTILSQRMKISKQLSMISAYLYWALASNAAHILFCGF